MIRIVRSRTLADLREKAEQFDGLVDQVQIHILRRARAVELLQEIDVVPPEAAAQIRIACEALTRGGEVVES